MSRKAVVLALAISVVVIVGGSLYPFHYRAPVSRFGLVDQLLFSSMRWPPLDDFIRNIIFYAPMGFLAGLVMPSRMPAPQRVALVILFAAVLSLGNEVLQYYVGRYTSMLDVYANVLGSMAGGLVSLSARRVGKQTGG
jgi:VanZ family protein